jgi:chaperone modulatory protein CbpM
VSHALTRVRRLDLDAFAAASGTHPELIRRLVALGILDATQDPSGNLWFAPGQLAVLARIQRLRAGFALNYAAIGLVTDLLDRITALEAALRRAARPGG